MSKELSEINVNAALVSFRKAFSGSSECKGELGSDAIKMSLSKQLSRTSNEAALEKGGRTSGWHLSRGEEQVLLALCVSC